MKQAKEKAKEILMVGFNVKDKEDENIIDIALKEQQKEIEELKAFINKMEGDTYIRMNIGMLKEFREFIKAKQKVKEK